MPKENDLEGAQDQGGKHGGQAGAPKPASGGPSKVLYRSAGRINLATKTERSKSVAKVRRTNLQASKR
jgi:hypothetical protein